MSEHTWTEAEPRFRVVAAVAEGPSGKTAQMIRIPGGTFRMGSEKHYPEEAPVHRVSVSDFWIDRTSDGVTIFMAAQPIVAKFLATFKDYPPSQRPSSFSIDQIVEKTQKLMEPPLAA
jgi:hypothetical protein